MSRFLPKDTLPVLSFLPAGTTVEWLESTEDCRESYLKRGGHPIYGEHDIVYSFNSLGYRSVDFGIRADLNVLAIGCSYVMGVGLRQQHLFHEVIAGQLGRSTGKSVCVYNLGAPGASNDYIARVLHLAIPILAPDLTLIHFTHAGRREYVSLNDRLLTYVPGFRPSDMVARDIYKHLDALSSPEDNDLNLFRNYKSIEALLRDRKWLFSSINPEFDRIKAHINLTRYVGTLTWLDKARDGCHPGPSSHKDLAERYWARLAGGAADADIPR
jgi:hypothetical protein